MRLSTLFLAFGSRMLRRRYLPQGSLRAGARHRVRGQVVGGPAIASSAQEASDRRGCDRARPLFPAAQIRERSTKVGTPVASYVAELCARRPPPRRAISDQRTDDQGA
jgi:hypothetical protein